MKVIFRLTILAILAIMLTLVACSTPPPPVSQSELQAARSETLEAEESAASSDQELQELEAQLSRREAELRSLRDYERQLGF